MRSIKLRMVTSMGLLLIMVCGIFGGIAYYSAYESLTQNVQQVLPQMAEQAAMILESRLSENFSFLEAVAEINEVQDPNVPIADKVAIIKDQLKGDKFTGLTFIDLEGNVYSKDGTSTINVSERGYFVSALAGTKFLTDPMVSKTDPNAMLIVFAVPIKYNDKVVGVLTGNANATALSSLTKDIKYGTSGNAFLISKEGVIIAHNNSDYILQSINNIKQAEKFKSLKKIADIEKKMISWGSRSILLY